MHPLEIGFVYILLKYINAQIPGNANERTNTMFKGAFLQICKKTYVRYIRHTGHCTMYKDYFDLFYPWH